MNDVMDRGPPNATPVRTRLRAEYPSAFGTVFFAAGRYGMASAYRSGELRDGGNSVPHRGRDYRARLEVLGSGIKHRRCWAVG